LARRAEKCRVTVSGTTGRQYWNFLEKELARAARLARSSLQELSVAVVGEGKMGQLHRRFMSLKGPTDVLSFEIESGARGAVTSGEVVACLPVAVREARRRGLQVRRELLLYAIHGMLHLSGFDDTSDAEYAKMHRMEDRILTSLGMGEVFARAVRGKGLGVGKTDDRRGRRCR